MSTNNCFFFFNDTATTEIYTLSLHDALPILAHHCSEQRMQRRWRMRHRVASRTMARSEEHTSELQSQSNLVCRLLLEKKKTCRWLEFSRLKTTQYHILIVLLLAGPDEYVSAP